MGIHMQNLQSIVGDPVKNELGLLWQKIIENVDSSRRLTYKLLNLNLIPTQVYKRRESVFEHHKIAYTRLRLG